MWQMGNELRDLDHVFAHSHMQNGRANAVDEMETIHNIKSEVTICYI